MSRDPIQHEPQLLLDGVRRIAAGERLDDTPTVLEELTYLGLALVTYDGTLALTREGRTFLNLKDPLSSTHGRLFREHRASVPG